jgi:hypothetical protein
MGETTDILVFNADQQRDDAPLEALGIETDDKDRGSFENRE